MLSTTQYDAWGNEQLVSGADTDPLGYNAQSGYYLDRESSLYLCQHRFYDPGNGRWINRDPIGYGGGTNLYGYCNGGPAVTQDPSGFYAAAIGAGSAAGFGEAAVPAIGTIVIEAGAITGAGLVGLGLGTPLALA